MTGSVKIIDQPKKQVRMLEEPVLFLRLASNAMEDYKRRHNRYPTTWFQLGQMGFVFDGSGSCNRADPCISPTQENREYWNPKNSPYTYRMVPSYPNAFLIQALDHKGSYICEIRSGQRLPVWLTTSPPVPPQKKSGTPDYEE